MNVDERMWECAKISSEICGVPAEFIYSQWVHESDNFTSELAKDYFNFGGITQEENNGDDMKQPDGDYYYKVFATPEDYAAYFGRYIKKYFPTAAGAKTLEEYVTALKYGEEYVYYGDDVEVYMMGTKEAFRDAFC